MHTSLRVFLASFVTAKKSKRFKVNTYTTQEPRTQDMGILGSVYLLFVFGGYALYVGPYDLRLLYT